MSWSLVPDDIWLRVLRHLDSADQLISLIEPFRQNGRRRLDEEEKKKPDIVLTLGRVACDFSLWRTVRFTGRKPSDLAKIKAFLGPRTTCLELRGPEYAKGPRTKLHVTEAFFQSLKLRCTNLETLALTNCCLDYNSSPFRGDKKWESSTSCAVKKISENEDLKKKREGSRSITSSR